MILSFVPMHECRRVGFVLPRSFQPLIAMTSKATVAVSSSSSRDKREGTSKAKQKKDKLTARKSKRGENEDSEVRYDRKHKLKASVSSSGSKKQKKSVSVTEDSVDSSSSNQKCDGDTATIVSGNEDDKGSVVSAILDEDICYLCGQYTLNGDEWDNVIMCDLCDGEYHLPCQGLECTPEGSFVCTKCVEDESFYKDVHFNVSDTFKVSSSYCFSLA